MKQGINDGIMNNYVYMKTWVTEIRTIDGNIWHGPNMKGLTSAMAQKWCDENGMGYCKIIGQLIMEIPCKPNTNIPDFDNAIDFDDAMYN